jgi:hypothetical protein
MARLGASFANATFGGSEIGKYSHEAQLWCLTIDGPKTSYYVIDESLSSKAHIGLKALAVSRERTCMQVRS